MVVHTAITENSSEFFEKKTEYFIIPEEEKILRRKWYDTKYAGGGSISKPFENILDKMEQYIVDKQNANWSKPRIKFIRIVYLLSDERKYVELINTVKNSDHLINLKNCKALYLGQFCNIDNYRDFLNGEFESENYLSQNLDQDRTIIQLIIIDYKTINIFAEKVDYLVIEPYKWIEIADPISGGFHRKKVAISGYELDHICSLNRMKNYILIFNSYSYELESLKSNPVIGLSEQK